MESTQHGRTYMHVALQKRWREHGVLGLSTAWHSRPEVVLMKFHDHKFGQRTRLDTAGAQNVNGTAEHTYRCCVVLQCDMKMIF